MYVSEVIGREKLDALLAEGKGQKEILAEANKVLDPLKKRLGDDVYGAFKTQGVPFGKMVEYADYQDAKALEAQKAKEEAEKKAHIENLTKFYEKEYDDDSFLGRLKTNALRVGSELDVVTQYLNPFDKEYHPETVAMIQAAENLNEKYAAKHRDPEQQKAYGEKAKAFDDAEGVWDTIASGAGLVKQKISNPSEWNMAALSADLLNPINLVSIPAGGVAGQLATKTATKAAVGAAVGAAGEGAINAGYEYAVAKGTGKSDEEAKKGAILGGAFGAAIGAPGGAVGAVLQSRWNAPKGNSVEEIDSVAKPNDGTQSFEMMPGTVMKDGVEIPEEIRNSTLLVLDEVEDHSSQATNVIKQISEQQSDPVQRDLLVEKHLPATKMESDFTSMINDGGEVHARLSGQRLREALAVSIEHGTQRPEELNAKLADAGFNEDVRAAVVESYITRDMSVYDNFVADKLETELKGVIDVDGRNQSRDGGADTTVSEGGTGGDTPTVREELDPNTKQEAISNDQAGDTADRRDTGRGTGEYSKTDELPQSAEQLDGQRASESDGGDVPGSGQEYLVQTEDGLRPLSEVENNPIDIYDAVKDDPEIPNDVKGRYRVEGENFELDMMEVSDKVIKRYEDTGFELRSYPNRLKAIGDSLESEGHTSFRVGRINDSELIETFGFKKEINSVREVSNSDVKHILENHGDALTERLRGQVAVTLDDIAAYTDIVDNPDQRIFTVGKNDEKFVVSAKQVNGHYTVVEEVSRKNNRLSLKTMYKGVGKLKEDALRPRDGESLLLTSDNAIGYEPIETMPSPRKAPEAKKPRSSQSLDSEIIAKEMGDVKKLSDLTSHRYFDEMVGFIKSQKDKEQVRYKRPEVKKLKESLEKRGLDPSEDVYKAEMQKLFKRDVKDPFDGAFHKYTKKEIKRIDDGKINQPLAKKLKDDLKEFYENPLFEKDREAIDGGWKEYASEVDMIRELEADEALGLVQSKGYEKAFDEPMSYEDLSTVIHERLEGAGEVLKRVAKKAKDPLDDLYGKAPKIKLTQAQERAIVSIKDPVKRTKKRLKFEHQTLKDRLKRAKRGKNKGAVTKADNNLKKWESEYMEDGKIIGIGKEC